MLPGNGSRTQLPLTSAPVTGSYTVISCPAALKVCEKSPFRCAMVGTEEISFCGNDWFCL